MEAYKKDLASAATFVLNLERAVMAAQEAEDEIRRIIPALREHGASWQTIGDILGVSKQAAQQRYGHKPAVTNRSHLDEPLPGV